VRPEVAALFPTHVAYAEIAGQGAGEPLFAEEAAFIARAVDKRKREFALGRTCARRALAALGVPAQPLVSNADRSVRWPDEAWGSVTHTDGFCAAVAALRTAVCGLGIDAEMRGRVQEKLWSQIAGAREVAWFRAAEDPNGACERATLLFSAKEAFYKAQFCVSATFVGFHGVEIDFDAHGGFTVHVLSDIARAFPRGTRLSGRYAFSRDHVVTGVVIPAAPGGPTTGLRA
jgi:4'-phosphopantetheinyl transferase EntD